MRKKFDRKDAKGMRLDKIKKNARLDQTEALGSANDRQSRRAREIFHQPAFYGSILEGGAIDEDGKRNAKGN